MIAEGTGAAPNVQEVVERGKRIEAAGFDTAWIAQIQLDAATASALVGQATERIEIGTAVIPTPLRHPFQMAVQATTTQQACGGRFTLGIGLSHKIMMEDSMGLSFDKPVLQMRETLEALAAMLSGEAFDYQGELYKSRFAPFELGTPVEVLVAALGPQMLRVTGRLAGGTIAWACGLETLEKHISPTLREAAREVGRPDPRVVAGFPVVVTHEPDRAREAALATFGHYKMLPSYKAMLDREGVEGVEDLLVAGDEASVRAQLRRIEQTGTTDLCVFPFAADEGSLDRTVELLGEIARESG